MLAFARSQVDAEPRGIELPIKQARIVDCLLGRADSKANIESGELEPLWVIDIVAEIEAFDFGRELGWKMRGIEMRDRTDPALRFLQRRPHGIHGVANRGHGTNPGHHDSASHEILPSPLCSNRNRHAGLAAFDPLPALPMSSTPRSRVNTQFI